MPASVTHADFINHLDYESNFKKFNIYTFRNFYNGGGVAGDVNNDGLTIYLWRPIWKQCSVFE